ncbi:MAG TPA: alpha-mannosidase [Planctomycetota bacterium]|nr:alpha-mannosidase [Planctomycetota bacterium]
MLRHPDYTRARLKQLAERMRAKIYTDTRPIEMVGVSTVVDRISFDEAAKMKYRPVKVGEQFGPLWATYWFKARITVPPEWAGKRIDLLWVSHSEATLWIDGRSIQGFNFAPMEWDKSARSDAVLIESARAGETLEFYVEMACNRMFGKGDAYHFKNVSPFVFDQCDMAVFDPEAWNLYYDFHVLQELEAEQLKDLDKTWGGLLLAELNRFANDYDPENRDTWDLASRSLKLLYTNKNATSVHELSAIGHAHIDTAWLWPLAETYRKCERTFSSQCTYMDAYPDYKFACSQAYQYEIIKLRNPQLYARIVERVKRGQWVPVGGTWIEPDCNIPSGESLARQFLYGQRFFRQEFGITCNEFWNPDVFGYNGQLPQLMKLSGIQYFLTQKLSWNRFTKPPHHTFTWQGIDGSEVLAHFPPADTYNAMASVEQLRDNARNYKDHDRSRMSLMLFGYGDGGGGPTKHMLEILSRAQDLEGLPRTTIRSSDEFFTLLDRDCLDRPVMIGELYFEYHRGTYTTQALAKLNNRCNEFLLHDAELACAIAHRLQRMIYPRAALERLWKTLLLNQFHDILPGSSIGLVYEDSARDHETLRDEGEKLLAEGLRALSGAAPGMGEGAPQTPFNTLGVAWHGVCEMPGGQLLFIDAPPCSAGETVKPDDAVSLSKDSASNYVFTNNYLRATIARDGRVTSLIERASGREALAAPGNVFQLFDDRPTKWDAWDVDPFHLETERNCEAGTFVSDSNDLDAEQAVRQVAGETRLRVEAVFIHKIGKASSLRQTVRLEAGSRWLEFHCDADWQESNAMLKVAFPVAVRAMNATYEMQFGHVERPTHYNTPQDLARYEVPGHKWADLSEHGFGVALLSDCKYGYSTYGNTMRLSLLRAPKQPDPNADIGRHLFTYALLPHAGNWRDAGVVADALRFNHPPVWLDGALAPKAYFESPDKNLILDTVKLAEDGEALILRLYEAHGARGIAKIVCGLPFEKASACNILEEDLEGAPPLVAVKDKIEVPYGPHQVISVKLT